VILGAGISGLSAAQRFCDYGIPVCVLESALVPGGLAGTQREGPYALDYGPHSFFTEHEEIREQVLNLLKDSALSQNRSVKLFWNGKYLDYPFTPVQLLVQSGWKEAVQTIGSFAFRPRPQPVVPEDEESLESWAVRNFGRRLYESFFKPYTEQFWKIPACELSARSVPSHTRLSFKTALWSILKTSFASGKKTSNQLEREKLPTFYPRTGFGEIAERLAEKLSGRGVKIDYGCTVRSVERGDENAFRIHFVRGGIEESMPASCLVSTVPLPHLTAFFGSAVPPETREAAALLRYRPLLTLGMVSRRKEILPASYLYTLNRPYFRLTEMNRFSEETSPQGENILAAEIPNSPEAEDWDVPAEALFERCIPFLEKDGFLRRQEVSRLLLVKARNAYPVYGLGYRASLDKVLGWTAAQENLLTLGRSGEFHYKDSDQCMKKAHEEIDAFCKRRQTLSGPKAPACRRGRSDTFKL
jgi:protoporphyrinogen oxidase